MGFITSYSDYFRVGQRTAAPKARSYLSGLLMKAPRKNMERMEEYVSEYDYQGQQQFLTDSPWDHRAVVEQVGRDVDAILGGSESGLLIDETAFEKKGTKSVGVARQWNGRLGKVDNCQVGVFAGLSDGAHVGLVDFRLYLPESWCGDPERCDGAKIPRDERQHKSKAEFALEMMDGAADNGLRFGWVGLDGGYGKTPWLLRAIEDRGLVFVADVHRTQVVYAEDPRPYLPRRRSGRGRKFSKRRPRVQGVKIQELFKSFSAQRWKKIAIRHSTKGLIKVVACGQRVWLWDGEEKKARSWWAVCYKHPSTGETKWFLSNSPETVQLKELVRMHAVRFWVERSFQDAKTSVGMGDYQARGWRSWHHHMAMVLMALLFLLTERCVHRIDMPLLSCTDIVELLNLYLPRADLNEEAVFRSLRRRHEKRRKAIESAYRVTGSPDPEIPI